MRYDRSAIMREANRLHFEEGFTRKIALKKAWANAREAQTAETAARQGPKAQEAGLRAAARRYGLDRLAERAQRAVAEAARLAVKSVQQAKPLLAGPSRVNDQSRMNDQMLIETAQVVDLQRDANGVWRAPQ